MNKEEKINNLLDVTEEIIGLEELKQMEWSDMNHYIGFEISGLVHLGTGLMSGLVIARLQEMGINTQMFLADWHTWINNKLGGDHEFIKRVAAEYFGPALKISAKIAGADDSKIKFINGSDLYHNNDSYWQSMIEVSKSLTLSRVVKSTAIMGRAESDSMPFGFLIYPPMQVADIFSLNAHIAHAGTDQRKVHVIAREVSEKVKIKALRNSKGDNLKPVCIHHHLLLGLQKPSTWPVPKDIEKDTIRTEMKMSKSIPGSAIFIHDSSDEIKQKIQKAFCPAGEVELNPVLDWVKYVILPIVKEFTIKREEKFGGNFTVKSFDEIKSRYESSDLFPLDLKNSVSEVLIDILKPARDLFQNASIIEEIKQKQSR